MSIPDLLKKISFFHEKRSTIMKSFYLGKSAMLKGNVPKSAVEARKVLLAGFQVGSPHFLLPGFFFGILASV